MIPLLVFAAVLLAAVFLSCRARRTAFSSAVLFIGAGFIAGEGVMGWIPLAEHGSEVRHLADLALFAVLFADGMRMRAPELRRQWKLPARALGIGMPLTFVLIALLGHEISGLAWLPALLIAAALSPTDPVFASAIVSRDDVAAPLRQLLNVESGLNDGLALPVLLALLGAMGARQSGPWHLAGEVVAGLTIGVLLPWVCNLGRQHLSPSLPGVFSSLFIVAVGLMIFSLTHLVAANEYLAAFTAGITLKSVAAPEVDRFQEFGEHLAELFKFAALLAFGALITPQAIAATPLNEWLFAALVLLLARPVAMALALAGTRLHWRERAAAAWFGPKGFASVVYAVIVLNSGLSDAQRLFQLIGLVVGVSVIAHSTTDVPMARWLRHDDDT